MNIVRRLAYKIDSKRSSKIPFWRFLNIQKDIAFLPIYYLCNGKLLRKLFFKCFGTTGVYEPENRGIISKEYQFIYFYINKVASTSIKKIMAQILFGMETTDIVHSFPFDEVLEVEKGQYTDYLKFSFVRNPWDRIVSCYMDKILHQNFTNYRYKNGVARLFVKKYKKFFYMGMTFEEFVRRICNIPNEHADRHFRSQHTFITDNKGNLIVDFIGRFENLPSDFDLICEKTGIPKCRLSHINKGTRERNYRKYYSEKTKMMIAERFKKDIELFGYRF